MAVQVIVYPSDLTPPPGAFQALVADVLADSGAGWVEGPEDGDLRLNDGTEIGLFLDDAENVAAFVLDDQNEAAFDLIYALAERGAAFVTVGQRACGLLPTGDVLPPFEAQLPNPDDLPNRRVFGDWMREAMIAERPRPQAQPSRRPQRSLIQRLTDALFGKEI